jgi:hypothetical protein
VLRLQACIPIPCSVVGLLNICFLIKCKLPEGRELSYSFLCVGSGYSADYRRRIQLLVE